MISLQERSKLIGRAVAVCALALRAAAATPAAAVNFMIKPALGTSIPVKLAQYCNDYSPTCYEGSVEIEGYEEFSPSGCDFHFGQAFGSGADPVPGAEGDCESDYYYLQNPICLPSYTVRPSAYNTVCAWRSDGSIYALQHFHKYPSRTLKVQVSYPGQTAYVWGEYWPGGTSFQFVDPSCIASKGLLCANNTLPCCEDIFQGPGACLSGTTRMAVGTYAQ